MEYALMTFVNNYVNNLYKSVHIVDQIHALGAIDLR